MNRPRLFDRAGLLKYLGVPGPALDELLERTPLPTPVMVGEEPHWRLLDVQGWLERLPTADDGGGEESLSEERPRTAGTLHEGKPTTYLTQYCSNCARFAHDDPMMFSVDGRCFKRKYKAGRRCRSSNGACLEFERRAES